ncbi:hypothetical protein LPJ64_002342 [Coemansia asiatica]|uniref:C3H1-type domain-containing protein n=1 Tax=Coemansia asiatica TaxID=1052880 RepID=A0A9W7XNB3_9FUNG|nr:hypothetical protein LPJ64_002342 [Coemansia asiatica]
MARQPPQTPRRQQQQPPQHHPQQQPQQQQQQQALSTYSASASTKLAPRSQTATDQVYSDPNDSCREDELKAHKSSKQQARSPSTRTLSDNASNDAESIENPDDSGQERSGGGHNGGSTLHVPCKFYKLGNCTAGSKCFFSHDVNLFVEKTVCKYFVKGNCRYGNKCALIHSGQNDAQPRSQTKSSGNGNRSAQNGSIYSNSSAKVGNGTRSVGGAVSGNSRKDRRANAEPSYSDAASGRTAANQQPHRDSPGAASGGAPSSTSTTTKSQSSRGSANDRLQFAAETPSTASAAFRDIPLKPAGTGALNISAAGGHHYGPGKMLASSWAPGSLTSALRREQNQRSQAAGLLGYKDQPQTLRADSGVMEFSNSPASRIQSSYHQQSALHQDDDVGDFSAFADHLNDKTAIPFGMHYGNAHGSSNGVDIELNSKSRPIPKPVQGASWARKGSDSAMAHNGLSMQDSLRIDKLALSHGAAHQSFTGSPFLSSMIPLLDQFSDAPRNESSFALGDSPMASPFANSPSASYSGAMLNRHAFSVVDPLAADSDTSGSGLLRVGASYHGHSNSRLQHHGLGSSMRNAADNGFPGRLDISPSLKPIANSIAGRSAPRNSELFGRSFRSSSLINEPLSPLAAFATATDNAEAITPSTLLGAAPLASPLSATGNNSSGLTGLGGRLRSNSHLHSPSLTGIASGVESGSIPGRPLMQDNSFMMKDRPLGGFSLTDTHLYNMEQQQQQKQRSTGNAGLWDSYNSFLGNESGNEQESRHPFAFTLSSSHMSNQRLGGLMQSSSSLGHMYHSSQQQQQQRQQQQYWARSPKMSLQGSAQASPFASAIGSFGGEPRQLTLPPLASGTFGSDMAKPGAIGQKPHRSNLSSLGMSTDYNGIGSGGSQHRSAFNGVESSISALNIPGVGSGSINASSTPSEQYDEIFELEQDVPIGIPNNANSGSGAISNTNFPSMNGLSQKLSGISLVQSRTNGTASSQSMTNISAIARPSA